MCRHRSKTSQPHVPISLRHSVHISRASSARCGTAHDMSIVRYLPKTAAVRIPYYNELISKETTIDKHVTSCTRILCWVTHRYSLPSAPRSTFSSFLSASLVQILASIFPSPTLQSCVHVEATWQLTVSICSKSSSSSPCVLSSWIPPVSLPVSHFFFFLLSRSSSFSGPAFRAVKRTGHGSHHRHACANSPTRMTMMSWSKHPPMPISKPSARDWSSKIWRRSEIQYGQRHPRPRKAAFFGHDTTRRTIPDMAWTYFMPYIVFLWFGTLSKDQRAGASLTHITPKEALIWKRARMRCM